MMPIYKILAFLSVGILVSCGDCDGDRNLGSLEITSTSLSWIPYDGSEQLTFKNESGESLELTSQGIKTSTARLNVVILCDNGLFDRSHEYYWTEKETIVFNDPSGRSVFQLELLNQFEDERSDNTIAVYDQLSISTSYYTGPNASIQIVTDDQLGEVSDEHKNAVQSKSPYIGDTILLSQPFNAVFQGSTGVLKSGGEKFVFYSKERGVIGWSEEGGSTWIIQ